MAAVSSSSLLLVQFSPLRPPPAKRRTAKSVRKIAKLLLLAGVSCYWMITLTITGTGTGRILPVVVRGFSMIATKGPSPYNTIAQRTINARHLLSSATNPFVVRDSFGVHPWMTRANSDDGECIEPSNETEITVDDSGADLVGDVLESIFTSASKARATATTTTATSTATANATTTKAPQETTNDVAAPFQALFRSTLQRAYSTTATLDALKSENTIDASLSSNPPQATRSEETTAGGSASSAVNSILDATVVETTTTNDENTGSNDSEASSKNEINNNNDDDDDDDQAKHQTETNYNEEISSSVNSLLDTTIAETRTKYARFTKTKKQRQTQEHHSSPSKPPSKRYEFPFATSYKSHPALNNVALAHSLWASVVRPNVDSVIDATCGNGNDSIVLAEILFGSDCDDDDESSASSNDSAPAVRSELVCVDVQSMACERTSMALQEVLPPSIQVVRDNDGDGNGGSSSSSKMVRVVQASHETLPRPTETSSVGLIVYNLGWLPGSNNNNNSEDKKTTDSIQNGKDCVTTMETTLDSLVDATSLLRVGGMLSVITYPQTGPDEDRAVRLFVTCLAVLSSKTRTWQEEIQGFLDLTAAAAAASGDGSKEDVAKIASKVTSSMEAVIARGDRQTWRVSQHTNLGMDRPPVLFTATRIK